MAKTTDPVPRPGRLVQVEGGEYKEVAPPAEKTDKTADTPKEATK